MSANPFTKLQYPLCTEWFLTVWCGLKFNTYINEHRLTHEKADKVYFRVNFQVGNQVSSVLFDNRDAAIHFISLNKDKIFVRGFTMHAPVFHDGYISYFVREMMI